MHIPLKTTICVSLLITWAANIAQASDFDKKCNYLAGNEWEQGNKSVELAKSVDHKKAVPACRLAVASNRSAANLFCLSRSLVYAGEHEEANKYGTESLGKLYPASFNLMAYQYFVGNGVEKKHRSGNTT